MRFHQFETITMDADYDHPDEFGNINLVERERHKVCINLNKISSIEQTGRWTQNANATPVAGTRPRRTSSNGPTSPRASSPPNRPQDVFVIDNTRFIIFMEKGTKQITVLGDFDEFASILTQFQDDREEV